MLNPVASDIALEAASIFASLIVALTFTPMASAFGKGNGQEKSGTTGVGQGAGWLGSWVPYAGRGRWFSRWPRLAGTFLTLGLLLGAANWIGSAFRRNRPRGA